MRSAWAPAVVSMTAMVACGPTWDQFDSSVDHFAVTAPGAFEQRLHTAATHLCTGPEREYLVADGPHLPVLRRLASIPSGYYVEVCDVSWKGPENDIAPAHASERLAREMDALIRSSASTLVESHRVTADGLEAVEYLAKTASGIVSRHRIVEVGGARYHLAAIGESEQEVRSSRAQRFLDSFRYLGERQ